MGSPVSPIVANIFMEEFEQNALTSMVTPPRLWKRYVDDTFCIVNRDVVSSCLEHLNSLHTTIKFTMEEEKGKTDTLP